jgi:hypothetical protein
VPKKLWKLSKLFSSSIAFEIFLRDVISFFQGFLCEFGYLTNFKVKRILDFQLVFNTSKQARILGVGGLFLMGKKKKKIILKPIFGTQCDFQVWLIHAYSDDLTHECNFWTQSVILTHTCVILTHMCVIYTRRVWFLHAVWVQNAQEWFLHAECDIYTESVIFGRNVWFRHAKIWLRHSRLWFQYAEEWFLHVYCAFPTQSAISTRRV